MPHYNREKIAEVHRVTKTPTFWEKCVEGAKNVAGLIVIFVIIALIRAFEKRIDKLEKQKIVLSEKVSNALSEKLTKSECMELSLSFLSNPWKVYENGGHATKQTVLRLAFQEPLTYCPNEAYGTPKLSFPFKVLGEITCSKKEMVL